MISELIKEKYIQLDKEASNFEDAIEISMFPLLNDNVITLEYVKSIKRICKEIGPYIVITKNIALPHAPSESGVNETAITFTRLKNSVISGNEANDPVKYLFGLSSKNNEQHLESLSELVELLSDKKFIDFLKNVESSQAFIKYLVNYERNGKND